MNHTIQLPEAVYQTIAAYAARHGQTPEEAIASWAGHIENLPGGGAPPPAKGGAEERVNNPAFDPWAGFRGITTALSPDSVERHDAYIAEESLDRFVYDPRDDPLAEFLGTIELTDPDAILHHDAVIAEDALDEHTK